MGVFTIYQVCIGVCACVGLYEVLTTIAVIIIAVVIRCRCRVTIIVVHNCHHYNVFIAINIRQITNNIANLLCIPTSHPQRTICLPGGARGQIARYVRHKFVRAKGYPIIILPSKFLALKTLGGRYSAVGFIEWFITRWSQVRLPPLLVK